MANATYAKRPITPTPPTPSKPAPPSGYKPPTGAPSKPGHNVSDASWKAKGYHQYSPWGRGRSPRWRSAAYSSSLGYAPTYTGSIGVNPDLIFAAGIGLIFVSNMQNGILRDIYEMFSHGTKNDIKTDLAVLGSEVLFIFILSAIARTSADASNMIFALIAGLWLVWAVVNYQKIQNFSDSITKNFNKASSDQHNVGAPKSSK